MPDIDTDFEDAERETVINYMKVKYGDECISRIGTIGKLAAKGIIRSIQRCEGKDIALANKICKTIPNKPNITLKDCFNEPEFNELYNSDKEVEEMVNEAMKLEGLSKTVGQHACGIIVAPSAVSDYVPQQLLKNAKTGELEPTTQYTGPECEDQGLLKMDFLGLRTLGVLNESIQDINKMSEENVTLENIPIDDKKVYNFLSEGNTDAVFQFESAFMKSNAMGILQDIKSNKTLTGMQCFNRLADATALGRPGPMAEIPNYVAALLDNTKIKTTNTPLDEITNPTYGIIVYQEQVMQAVKALAGFSAGQADTVRKVMGKKLIDKLAELREWFINGNAEKGIPGCIKNGYAKEFAEKLWDRMAEFGKYAFNKSHAVAYTYLSAKTAWLSYYYPSIYMKATLNSFISDNKKIKQYINVCKSKGIKVLSPNVNKSQETFTVDFEEGNNSKTSPIRFGLKGIKSLGAKSKLVIEEREKNGEFTSYQDFVKRMIGIAKFDKAAIVALIMAGALDEFEGTRKNKIDALEQLEEIYKTEAVAARNGQLTLIQLATELGEDELLQEIESLNDIVIYNDDEYENLFKLSKEKEYAGFYISSHPVNDFKEIFKKEGALDIADLIGEDEETEIEMNDSLEENTEEENVTTSKTKVDEVVTIGGIIKDVEVRYTKKDNSKMKTFVVEDDTDEIKVVIFPKILKEGINDKLSEENQIVLISGKLVEDESFGKQILVETIKDIKTLTAKAKEYFIKIPYDLEFAKEIKNYLAPFLKPAGDIKVNFVYMFNGHKKGKVIGYTDSLLSTQKAIIDKVGENNFVTK